MNFIERLQNKPRYIRVQIFLISVILVMTVIIFTWLFFLKSSLESSNITQEPSREEQSIPSLFNTLKEDFSILKKNLKAEIKGVLEINEDEKEFEVEIIKPMKLPER